MTEHIHGPNRLVPRPDADGVARKAEILRSRALHDVYEATPQRAGLCDFDAWGMDVIEGRRA
ncbi:hypothetical protein ACQR2B_06760 [Bradyrhizobium oligotrophicum]|uniref:hypothetical protein n=1 Tax=Bradyrhizobium TaxID=374 RepID=UPI003EBC0BA4